MDLAHTHTPWRPFRLAALLAPCAFLALAACSAKRPDHPPVHPVRGQVFFNGQPAAGAVVTFHPVGNPSPEAVKPQAIVEADGTFRPNSFELRDGAPAGEYTLTLYWPSGRGPIGPDRLMGQYNNPAQSVFKITVKDGDNVLDPIRIE